MNFKIEGGAAASQTGGTCGIIIKPSTNAEPYIREKNKPIVK
jgi:hypothetical protein